MLATRLVLINRGPMIKIISLTVLLFIHFCNLDRLNTFLILILQPKAEQAIVSVHCRDAVFMSVQQTKSYYTEWKKCCTI